MRHRGNVAGGQVGFHGIARDHGGDLGEGDAGAAGPRLRCVVDRRGQHGAQGFGGLGVDVQLELVGGVGLVLVRCVGHAVLDYVG